MFLGRRVVRFYTNGKRADDAYGLSKHVGAIVKRTDAARKRAFASTARRAPVLAKAMMTAGFNVPAGEVTNKVHVYDTGDTLHVNASVRKFPLSLFGGQWGGPTSPGASASVRVGQSEVYPGAFMAAGRYMGRALDLIYRRVRGSRVVQKYGRYKGKVREKIQALRGPSPYDMLTMIERGTARGKSGAGDYHRELRSYFVSELRRLLALEGRGNG